MLVKDSVAAECRYAYSFKKYNDWVVISDASVADYQGQVCLFAALGRMCVFIYYNYGSCSGCDDFESRECSEAQITEEVLTRYVKEISLDDFIAGLPGDVRYYIKGLIEEKVHNHDY